MRRCLTVSLFAAAMLAPLTALAQDPNCPPGAWFCEEADVPPPPPPSRPSQPPAQAPIPERAAPAPADQAPPPRTGAVVVPPPQGRGAPPPVVVYQPVPSAPPPQVIIVAGRPVQFGPPPPPPRRRWHSEWGFNLRLEGVLLGGDRGAARDAGMGGMGMSLRYRPVPAFALDFGLDLVGGKDYNGFDRTEVPLSLSGILFVNPRSRVQVYFLGGFDHSNAHVRSDSPSPLLTRYDADGSYSNDYSYFGGHGGMGLEIRATKHVAFNVDLIGFMRNRTDDGTVPEFVNKETGQTTNASGGGLFRGGLTFWW